MSPAPTSAPVPLIISSPCFDAVDPISNQPTSDAFHFITSQQNFTDGFDLCISLLPDIGAYPASVRNAQEYSMITDIYFANFPLFANEIESGAVRDPSLNYFMGLIDPVFSVKPTNSVERFHWIDGTPIEFGNISGAFPWAEDQPNNFGSKYEGCLEYRREKVGWNDAECFLERMMLCRSPCPPPTESPTKSPTSQPTISPTTSPTSSPTFQPTTSPINITYHPTRTPSKSEDAIVEAGAISTTVIAFVVILGLLAIAIILVAMYVASLYIHKRNKEKRFTLDIEYLPFDKEDNVRKLVGKVKLRNNKNNGPPLPPREGSPTGLTPLQSTLEFHDNRVSSVQTPRAQHDARAKSFAGLAAARNLLGFPPFFRGSTTTVGTGATDPSLRPPLGETRETLNTFVTKQRSALSGLTSPTVPSSADQVPKISSDDENEKIITRSPKPPGLDLGDWTKTTLLTDDQETEYEL